MRYKATIGVVLTVVVLVGLPLACKAKQGNAGTSATASISPEQQQRLELLKSEGPNASLTILPVPVGGNPFDRMTEAVGWLLEQKGLKSIELGKTAFASGSQTDMAQVAVSLGEFVKKDPITTGYALYAEFNGQRGVDELRAIVVDKSGALVWSDRLTTQDEAWKKTGGGDLLVWCGVLAERLAPQFGLNEQTARDAKPGRMAAIMAERSGQPPEDQTAPLAARQAEMKKAMPQATLVIFPGRVRVADHAPEVGNAANLVKAINGAGLCRAEPATQAPLLKASQDDPNEMKVLWDLAREFREYVQKNPVDADYVLYADCRFNPQLWQAGFVHLIVCDRKGEWVIADLRNSDHPDYQRVKPTSREDCDKILVTMLQGYQKANAASASAAVDQPPMDPVEAQKVLDRLLGSWNWELTGYNPGANPEETHLNGWSSYTRVLGGSFVQETTGIEPERETSVCFYTYDQRQGCYRLWVFLSEYGPDAPFNGKWNEATHTIDWAVTTAEGYSLTCQHRFVSEDAFECTILAKDTAGITLWRQEFKFTRAKEPQKANQPATGTGTPVLGQTPEQKVLDRFLGTWSQETTVFKAKWTPEEKHTTETCSFTRILGGRFVRQTIEDVEKENRILQLFTYDELRKCYRFWLFDSNFGGPEAPTSATWNEAARILKYFDFPANEGQRPTCQTHFVSDNETLCVYMVQDAAGETLYRAEFKMSRMK